jgi:hypothetical protein
MLHDMAEVLEVQEGPAEEAQQLAATQAHQEAAAVAAAAAAGALAALARVSSGAAAGSSCGAEDGVLDSTAIGTTVELASSAAIRTSAADTAAAAASAGGDSSMWQPSLPAGALSVCGAAAAAAGGELPPHELALQEAWAREEALVHGDLVDSPPNTPTAQQQDPQQQQQQQQQHKKRRRLTPLPRLQELLCDALPDWNPAGRPDASGTAMIGGSVLLCLESLAGLFSTGAAAAGASGAAGVDWGQVLAAALAPHGQLQVGCQISVLLRLTNACNMLCFTKVTCLHHTYWSLN